MAALDPRTPVIVGVAQVVSRTEPADADEPADLMAEAVRRAAADSGAPALAGTAQSFRVVNLLSWRYGDPARLVAERVGAEPAETVYTAIGGNVPQSLLNRTFAEIQAGDLDVAVVAGGEVWRSRMALRREGVRPGWTEQPEGTAPTTVVGDDSPLSHEAETARGLAMPVQVYPLFESALRAEAGRSIEQHQRHLGELWARFSEVAEGNPNAWMRERWTAEDVRTVTPENRMVGFPYPKSMNSNNHVDMAAAIMVCSVGAARRHGVPVDRWVFPLAGADASDTQFVSHRHRLTTSPAIRVAGRRALERAGVTTADLTHVDLYSCFPSAVQVAAAELGLGLDRDLTVTGGMSFAGGPWNSYVCHSVATMVGRLRGDAGATGMVTANGGYLTKHAVAVYATRPPAGGFVWERPQDEVDAAPRRDLDAGHTGAATVEAYTVMFDRGGEPSTAFAACLTPDGARTWGTSEDPGTMAAMVAEEHVGRPAHIDEERRLHI